MYPRLSDEDWQEFKAYVETYSKMTLMDQEHSLHEWSVSKRHIYEDMFNGRLRVQYPIPDNIADSYGNAVKNETNKKLKDIVDKFIRRVQEWMVGESQVDKTHHDVWVCLMSLLTQNSATHVERDLVLPLAEGKKGRVIPRETKILKAIRRLLELIKYSDTNKFKKLQSDYSSFNAEMQQSFSGSCLTLSIHPIDFLTMSDNECGWRSCLTWRKDGCYKAGFIDMLNSPHAIIGYITSRKDPVIRSDRWKIPNKSWRCLFFSTDTCVLSGKGYPFINRTLADLGVDTIVSMRDDRDEFEDGTAHAFEHEETIYEEALSYKAREFYRSNLGSFSHEQSTDLVTENFWKFRKQADKGLFIPFLSGYMYNDWTNGSYDDINKVFSWRHLKGAYDGHDVVQDMSGRLTCLRCGKVADWTQDELEDYQIDGRESRIGKIVPFCDDCVMGICSGCGNPFNHNGYHVRMHYTASLLIEKNELEIRKKNIRKVFICDDCLQEKLKSDIFGYCEALDLVFYVWGQIPDELLKWTKDKNGAPDLDKLHVHCEEDGDDLSYPVTFLTKDNYKGILSKYEIRNDTGRDDDD